MSASISGVISDKRAEMLIEKFRDKIENKSSLKNCTRYCQIESSQSGQKNIIPISNLHELIEKNQGNEQATNALQALDTFVTKHQDKIMDLKEFREAKPAQYKLIEMRAFSGQSRRTQKVLDYITSPGSESVQHRLTDDEIIELGQSIIDSAPENILDLSRILDSKISNLTKFETEWVKRRLNKFFDNETAKLAEQITYEWDLETPDYEFLGNCSDIKFEPKDETWKQKWINFSNERKNLDQVNPETGLREHLIDCLYDFNLAHFKDEEKKRNFEKQICAYITSIVYSPYLLTESEIIKLQERLDEAQKDQLELIIQNIDSKIKNIEEIKTKLHHIKNINEKEIKQTKNSNDTIQDPPLPLTANSPTRPSEEVISTQTEGLQNDPRISEISFEEAEKQIQRLGQMIVRNSGLARLPMHLREYICFSNLKSPIHSEIQTLDELIAKSNGTKREDLLAFKTFLIFNPGIFENLRIFRLEFPDEYQAIITKHFENGSLEIAVLNFLTGDTLIDRFCKSIIDIHPQFQSKMYEVLISKNHHLNEMRIIPRRINKHFENQIEMIKKQRDETILADYGQIRCNRENDTWSYLKKPIFQNTRSWWEQTLHNYLGPEDHLGINEIDPNTGTRLHLINRLCEFNITHFYDSKQNRNINWQIEALIISITKFKLDKNEVEMLIKKLEEAQKAEMPKTREYEYFERKITSIREIKDQISIQLSDIEYNSDSKTWFRKQKKAANQEKVSSSSESTPSKTSEERSSDESPARSIKRTGEKPSEQSSSSTILARDAIPNYYELNEKDNERIAIDEFLRTSANLTVRQGIELLSRVDSKGRTYGVEEVMDFLYRLPKIS